MALEVVWGLSGHSNALIDTEAPGTHEAQVWGDSYVMVLGPATGTSQLLTASQAADVLPWPYAYLYDVVFSVTATSNVTGLQADIYNAVTSGSSIFTGVLPLTANLSALTSFSARFAASPIYNKTCDPYLVSEPLGPVAYARGQVFSLRMNTAGANTITNLTARLLFKTGNSLNNRPFDRKY